MIKSRPSNGLIPQQGGARGIKTMVIRVDRLKKKKKEVFSIQSMMMKFTRGRWTNLVLYMYTREWNTCTDTWHMWYCFAVRFFCLLASQIHGVGGPLRGTVLRLCQELHGSFVHFLDMARGNPCTHHHHLFDLRMIPAPQLQFTCVWLAPLYKAHLCSTPLLPLYKLELNSPIISEYLIIVLR